MHHFRLAAGLVAPLAVASLVAAAPSGPAPSQELHLGAQWMLENLPTSAALVNRGVCNADNCLRALRATQRAATATPFCRAYISIPVDTVTVASVTPTSRVASTATSSTTKTNTQLTVETGLATLKVDSTTTQQVTSTTTNLALKKRADVPVPDFMQEYPAERISSACSCLSLTRLTTSVTYTAPTQTVVDVSTKTNTAAVEVTQTSKTTLTTTVYNAPSTVTQVTVQTATAPRFALRVQGGSLDGQYLRIYEWSAGDRCMSFSTARADAVRFRLGDDNTLRYTDKTDPHKGVELASWLNSGWDILQVYFFEHDSLVQWGPSAAPLMKFSVGPQDKILRADPSNANSMVVIKACPDYPHGIITFTLSTPQADKQGCIPITLVAEPM